MSRRKQGERPSKERLCLAKGGQSHPGACDASASVLAECDCDPYTIGVLCQTESPEPNSTVGGLDFSGFYAYRVCNLHQNHIQDKMLLGKLRTADLLWLWIMTKQCYSPAHGRYVQFHSEGTASHRQSGSDLSFDPIRLDGEETSVA